MKRLIFEFLNTKYKGIVIYHQRLILDNRTVERFITDSYEGIMDFTYYHNGKEVRNRVNRFIVGQVKDYFDIHIIDIESYVLEWCRDKSVETIEM